MDGRQFDRLTQGLAGRLNRRRLGLVLAALGLASEMPAQDASAAKKRKKKKKKKQPSSQTNTTCNNGVRNGAETDVDCGGPLCPPCANGQDCAARADCRSGRCQDGICRICTATQDCGADLNGACFCDTVTGTCLSQNDMEVDQCSECPAGWSCVPGFDLSFFCHPVCGSSDSCGTADACREVTFCGRGGTCFRPLGGGLSRCGNVVSASGTCGCTSDRQCANQFGEGAFCVDISGSTGSCSCGGATTFCVKPA